MEVYFDNAATTPMDPKVIAEMADIMGDVYGNASAIHGLGRKARAAVEIARKKIATLLNCDTTEIIFTGSGTEADNMALRCAVRDLGAKHIITSEIEHKAVLDTAKEIASKGLAEVHFVKLDQNGRADLEDLTRLATKYPGALISLMHANNEVGTLNDLHAISAIARANDCLFHSDTVQTVGHYKVDLKDIDVDFITCSAHKFHGPKGTGFLYKNKSIKIKPIITGGGQESKLRAGTENVVGIVGLAKALDLANGSIDEKIKRVSGLKQYFIEQLKLRLPGVAFNGDTSEEGGLYTVLNVSLPPSDQDAVLLYQLDMNGVYVSGGSACNSGAVGESHVLAALNHPENRTAIRFSFSKFSTIEEVDYAIDTLLDILQGQ